MKSMLMRTEESWELQCQEAERGSGGGKPDNSHFIYVFVHLFHFRAHLYKIREELNYLYMNIGPDFFFCSL